MNKTSELDIKVLKEDIDKTSFIGEVKSGFLTEAQMQAQVGLGWILSDGRDVTGSAYETLTGNTNVPDTRGKFLRSLDNGAGIDPGRALASAQEDDNKAHSHRLDSATTTHQGGSRQMVGSFGNQYENGETTEDTGTESRPKNIAVNYFIRIN